MGGQTLIVGIMAVIVLLLLAFIAFYAFKLAKAGKAAQGTAQRFQLFMQRQSQLQQDVKLAAEAGRSALRTPSAKSAEPPPAAGAVRVFERLVGLSSLSADPIFVRRTGEGVISVQVADKPAMPLTYILDPRSRRILNEVVGQATSEFGLIWAILAEDGEEGKLTITRLV
jgi:Sec-independent protein translocase protein TatA